MVGCLVVDVCPAYEVFHDLSERGFCGCVDALGFDDVVDDLAGLLWGFEGWEY